MPRQLPAATALIFLILALVLAEPVGADEPALADQPALTPQAGLLVLRNGRVIAGEVTRAGDRFLVAVGEQDEVTVPTTAVEFFCRDLAQAYELKQAAVRLGNLADVLDLAEWCLRHQLHREAAEQVLRALAQDRDDPRIARLERRLHVALEARSEPPPASTAARTAVNAQEIEHSLAELPPGAIERFTGQVQPLLLNRCGAGRCHGTQSNSAYQLTHPISGYRLTTQMTQRNLFQTLKHIDRKQPQSSHLLTVPDGPHGDLVVPVFNDHEQDKRRQLEGWVHSLATSPTPRPAALAQSNPLLPQSASVDGNQPSSVDGSLASPNVAGGVGRVSGVADVGGAEGSTVVGATFEAVAQSAPAGSGPLPQALVEPASYQADAPYAASPQSFKPQAPSSQAPSSQALSPQPLGPAGQPAAFVPRDAFDPELFNRRYFPAARR